MCVITWIVKVYLKDNPETPIKQGFIEQASEADAIEAVRRSLDEGLLDYVRIDATYLSVAPNDEVLWV